MTIHAAKIIWKDIQINPPKELISLNTRITNDVESVFREPDNNEFLKALEESSNQLPVLIPSLEGEVQVYFAKLYRVCRLLLE